MTKNNMVKKVVLGTLDIAFKTAIVVFAIYFIVVGSKRAFAFGHELLADSDKASLGIVDVDIKIPKGASTETIANILEEKELIGNALYFRVLSHLSDYDGSFQYGEYHFNTGMTEKQIMEALLTEGEKRKTVKFTIPEGFTIDQIAKKLDAEEICDYTEFMEAVNEETYGYKFLDHSIERKKPLQGYLFPSTYEVYEDATAKDIVSKLLGEFDKVFKPEYYKRAEELGYSIDEIVIIASIIEKEIRVDAERELASAVIYNRLKIDMNLQMCSTIQYTLDKPRAKLTIADTKIASNYNTYINPGLPVGPICNPGARSIEAALYPDDNDYLYFVLVDEEVGAHEFNTDYNEHINAMRRNNQDF